MNKDALKQQIHEEFHAKVVDKVKNDGYSIATAKAEVARSNPALHRRYIALFNEKPAKPAQQNTSAKVAEFDDLVNTLEFKHNVPRAEAINRVCKRRPDLRKAFVDAVNSK